MTAIFFRTIIIYIILIVSMRLMGKRQLGELEIEEFVITILLSEIASMPITNPDLPVIYAIIPIIILLTMEIGSAILLQKFPKLKNLLSVRPNTIIEKGKLNQKELSKIRISTDELLSALRLNKITDISDIEYAIIETNGRLSVFTKKEAKDGIMHLLVFNGKFDERNLKHLGYTREKVEKIINSKKTSLKNVYILTADDKENITLIKKEEK